MKLFYKDPKKKILQKIEIALMVLLLPIGLYGGLQSYQQWQTFRQAEALYTEGAEFCHVDHYEQGIPKLEKAVELYPPYYAAWESLGVSHHMMGDHAREVEIYEEAVEIMPDNGDLRRELASAYHEIGEHEKELEQAELALQMANNDPTFTLRVAERARKETSGETSTEPIERPNLHDHDDHAGHSH